MKKINKLFSVLGAFSVIFGVCCAFHSAGAMQTDKSYKVVTLGNCGVGKTDVIRRLVKNENEYNVGISSLSGDWYQWKIVHENTEYNFNIWDTAGQKGFSSGTQMFLRDAKAYLLVCAIADDSEEISQNSIKDLSDWIEQVKKAGGKPEEIILFANKHDLITDDKEIKTKLNELEKLVNRNGIKYCLLGSTKTGENIGEMGSILANIVHNDNVKKRDSILANINDELDGSANKETHSHCSKCLLV